MFLYYTGKNLRSRADFVDSLLDKKLKDLWTQKKSVRGLNGLNYKNLLIHFGNI